MNSLNAKIQMIRIGIVDDHKLHRRSVSAVLDTFGGIDTVLSAGNGQELLEQLKNIQPDVILLDLRMPIMDGFEACKIVRSMLI